MNEVELVKKSRNQLNDEIMERQLRDLCSRAIGKTYSRFGWTFTAPKIEKESGLTSGSYLYVAKLNFRKKQKRERSESGDVREKQFADILRKLMSYGRSSQWFVDGTEGSDSLTNGTASRNGTLSDLVDKIEGKQEFNLELPDNIMPHFRHIFDRDSQIRIVHSAIQSAIASKFERRNHCLLYGRPACAKTEILRAFRQMIGQENIVELNAESTTKAGAENLLLEMETVPPIMILEEAEKCNPANLPWLLGVLDQRGEIIKTNARIGTRRKLAKTLCLATVNDLKLFKEAMAGALASRFQHKVYCPRPTRQVLTLILKREIKLMKGDERWIAPVLDYILDVEKTDDPRRAIALLDGREKLLDGSYQKDLMKIWESEKADNEKEGQG